MPLLCLPSAQAKGQQRSNRTVRPGNTNSGFTYECCVGPGALQGFNTHEARPSRRTANDHRTVSHNPMLAMIPRKPMITAMSQ